LDPVAFISHLTVEVNQNGVEGRRRRAGKEEKRNEFTGSSIKLCDANCKQQDIHTYVHTQSNSKAYATIR
jgi:hypothetical protein